MDISALDKRLVSLSASLLDVSLVNPVNTADEKERFFADRDYQPQFRYKEFDASSALSELESMDFPSGPEGALLKSVQEFLLRFAQSLAARGTPTFTDTSLYGRPDQNLLLEAEELLAATEPAPPRSEPFPASRLKEELEAELAAYGVQGWQILLDRHMNSAVSVNSAAREIRIREHRRFSQFHIEKLKTHEIATHVLRGENGRLQLLQVLATEAVPGALLVEEGLAGYNEALLGLSSIRSKRTKALRVLAVHAALHGSFRDVYERVRAYVPEERAFRIAVRAKRGLGDTSLFGGFIKDHVYLEGERLVREFVLNGGDLTFLYAGKIGMHQLSLPFLEAPRWLPKFYAR